MVSSTTRQIRGLTSDDHPTFTWQSLAIFHCSDLPTVLKHVKNDLMIFCHPPGFRWLALHPNLRATGKVERRRRVQHRMAPCNGGIEGTRSQEVDIVKDLQARCCTLRRQKHPLT